jgi:hypothetical protein
MDLVILNKHLSKIIFQYIDNRLPYVKELHNLLKSMKLMIDGNICYSTKYYYHPSDDINIQIDNQLKVKHSHNDWYLLVVL